MKTLVFIPFLVLVGCAQAPITEQAIPKEKVDACVKLSERHEIAGRAALRGGVEAARASGVAYGISLIAPSIGFATIAPYIAGGYFLTSAINGAIEAQDRRDEIVRECLRDKGYRVY